jgi:antitoxin component YwqK of YwqJK toxin-antitoxin module
MIGYTKYKHYIITIDVEEQFIDNNYKTLYCNNFKVIGIKDILNNYYDEIDKYKIFETYIDKINFYILEELAFYENFISEEQYKLYPNGYSGSYKSYDRYGNLIEDFFHINGKIEGTYIRYYTNIIEWSNGVTITNNSDINIDIKCEYINGKLNGKFIQYHNNKNIIFDYNFANGIKHGMCIDYDINGNILKKIEYDNGDFNGYYYEIDILDNKTIECTYKNNLFNGEYKEYDLNKKLILKCNYNLGKIIDYTEYDENDNIKFFTNIS